MKLTLLGRLDHVLHRVLDRYISHQRPGWGRLQLWQWHVCTAYENHYERVTKREDG